MKKYLLLFVTLLAAGYNGLWAATADDSYISFQDSYVKAVCITNWDTNGDGELSRDEAAAVTSLGSVFSENEELTKFNELQYFIGLTTIDDYAFSYCTSLQEVTLPQGISVIGVSAFDGCEELKGVSIPSHLAEIGEWAFNGCGKITKLNFPSSLISIGNYAFGDCSSLSELSFSDGIVSIGEGAFQNCPLITAVTLPASLSSLGWGAFYDCNGLVSVTVLFKTPLEIEGATFSNRSNAKLLVPNGCLAAFSNANIWREFMSIEEMPKNFITFEDDEVKSVCIAHFDTDGDGGLSLEEAADVTSIGTAFEGNDNISSFDELRFFTGLSELEPRAFRGCINLKKITLPLHVNSIGEMAFGECFSLSEINVVEENTAFASNNGVLFSKNLQTLVLFPVAKDVSYDVPEGTVTVGISAFYGALLKEVSFPASLTTIEEEAFAACESLQKVEFAEGLASIGDRAFFFCSNLTQVTLPSSLTNIGEMAFDGCDNLMLVNSLILSPMPIDDNCFSASTFADAILHVSMLKDELYLSTEGWRLFNHVEDDLNRIDDVMIVSVEDVDIHPGAQTQIELCLNNSAAVIDGYQFDLILPEGFVLEDDENGGFVYSLSERYPDIDGVNISILPGDGLYHIECTMEDGLNIIGSEGALLSLMVKADDNLPEDSFMANIFGFSCHYIYDVDLLADNSSFVLQVVGYGEGDVNHDDLVNVSDVMLVINHVLGKFSEFFHDVEADVNHDTRVDVADAMGIVKSILNTSAGLPKWRNVSLRDGLQLRSMGTDYMVSMDNLSEYSAFQLDITLPEGASLRNVELCNEASAGHSVSFNKLDDGHYKVVAFSLGGKMFRDDAHNLLRFSVDGASADDIRVSQIQFTNADFETVDFNDIQTVTDGIDEVATSSSNTDTPVYNLQGQKTNDRYKGVYIKNGKKYIRK